MRSIRVLCGLVLFALAATASGQEFLAPGERDFSRVLPPRPTDDSPAGLADLDTLLHLQAERTPAQAARAQRIAAQSHLAFGQAVFGAWFTARNLPRTDAIFQEIDREEGKVVQEVKNSVHRPRPYQRDARIVPVVPKPDDGSSYPSGHSAGAAVWGAVLAAAFPEDAAKCQAQVHETMWCRELGGVHFPSDTEAGRLLGREIARRMLAAPAMARALEEIRAEAAPFRHQPAAAPTPAATPAPTSTVVPSAPIP